MEERVQKILAHRGLGSRREIEEWIREGRVVVNGQVARLGDKADPERDTIRVDNRKITRKSEPKVYYLLHKPKNVVSTLSDPERRVTIREYLGNIRFRVYPAGRLDYDSEGLLLLSNDGELTNTLLHPSASIPKVYHVKVQGQLSVAEISRFKRGLRLEDGKTRPAGLSALRSTERASWWEVTLFEGRKRQIRRMFDLLGHRVQRLRRVRIGTLSLGGLKPGEWRSVEPEELEQLRLVGTGPRSRTGNAGAGR